MLGNPSTPGIGPMGLMSDDTRGGSTVAPCAWSWGGRARGRCWTMGGGWSCICCDGRRSCCCSCEDGGRCCCCVGGCRGSWLGVSWVFAGVGVFAAEMAGVICGVSGSGRGLGTFGAAVVVASARVLLLSLLRLGASLILGCV